jgi:hypothetical protein
LSFFTHARGSVRRDTNKPSRPHLRKLFASPRCSQVRNISMGQVQTERKPISFNNAPNGSRRHQYTLRKMLVSTARNYKPATPTKAREQIALAI